jgi:hypothetical protein
MRLVLGYAFSASRLWMIVMNRIDKFFGLRNEAKVRYLDGEFEVLSPGDFVRCAVSGQQIPLADLKYWNVDVQEPYANAELSMKRFLELRHRHHGS